MLLKLNQDLKTAILELPEKEKEKLLIRLIRKDRTLINQLHFQLLEDEIDLEERRAHTHNHVDTVIKRIRKIINNRPYHSRQLLIDLKSISGHVNEHVLITKDKPGELEFRLHILLEIFNYADDFFKYSQYDNEKLLKYVTGRIKNAYTSYNKLHEDLQYDYQEKINGILKFAYSSALKNYLEEIEIPKEV